MRLVIDIPEEIYNYIHNEHITIRVRDSHKVANAIANSTPLVEVFDEIRNEIDGQVLESLSDGGDDWFTAEKVSECLEIIDNYIDKRK